MAVENEYNYQYIFHIYMEKLEERKRIKFKIKEDSAFLKSVFLHFEMRDFIIGYKNSIADLINERYSVEKEELDFQLKVLEGQLRELKNTNSDSDKPNSWGLNNG